MTHYRQGDVLLEAVKSIPETALPRRPQAQRVVLAEGEVTGHSHSMPASSACLLEDAPSGDRELCGVLRRWPVR